MGLQVNTLLLHFHAGKFRKRLEQKGKNKRLFMTAMYVCVCARMCIRCACACLSWGFLFLLFQLFLLFLLCSGVACSCDVEGMMSLRSALLQAAATDKSAVLLFSGGYTRVDAGQMSEAGSYWQVADALNWFGHDSVKLRAILEVREILTENHRSPQPVIAHLSRCLSHTFVSEMWACCSPNTWGLHWGFAEPVYSGPTYSLMHWCCEQL
jgi:hypothetical protein